MTKAAQAQGASTAAGALEREARLLAYIEHRGVVPIHDVFSRSDGQAIYGMRVLSGETLMALLARRPLRLSRAVGILHALCETMAAVHERGVLHLDLKPEPHRRRRVGDRLVA